MKDPTLGAGSEVCDYFTGCYNGQRRLLHKSIPRFPADNHEAAKSVKAQEQGFAETAGDTWIKHINYTEKVPGWI